jgi:pimeloyl-ACP methyl ester carboxylesterase
MAASSAWTDGWFWSLDGLRLHYRDYAGPADRPVLLCLPGLTRSARDFANFAERHAGAWRVVVVDLRGRGESSYAKDSLSYVPLTYLQDLHALLSAARIERFVGIGTSLGGLLVMLMTATHREAIAGAVLNDVGPVVEPGGQARLRGNVGRGANWPTWMHAARDLYEHNAAIYPDWTITDWLAFAKRLCRLTPTGRIVFDYDARIAEAFRLPGGDAGLDLWAGFDALAQVPVLSVRGELSDVLSADTQAAMAARHPGLHAVAVPRVGHAPTLDEPEAVAAVAALLEQVQKRAVANEDHP